MSSRTRRRSLASRFESGSSKQQHLGLEHQGPRDRDPLLLPARELGGQPRVEPLEADQGQLLARHAREPGPAGTPVTTGP